MSITRRNLMAGGAALALTPILPAIPFAGISEVKQGNEAVMAFAIRSRDASLAEARMMVQAILEMVCRKILQSDDELARAAFAYYDHLAYELRMASPEGRTVDQYVDDLTRAYRRPLRYLEPHKGRASQYIKDTIKPIAPHYHRLSQEREARIWGKRINRVQVQA
jgi:hypothetical protein